MVQVDDNVLLIEVPEWDEVPDDLCDIDVESCGDWHRVYEIAFRCSPAIGCLLSLAGIKRDANKVDILFDSRVVEKLNNGKLENLVDMIYKEVLGQDIAVSLRSYNEDDLDKEQIEALNANDKCDRVKGDLRERLLEHDAVQSAIDMFDPVDVSVKVRVDDNILG